MHGKQNSTIRITSDILTDLSYSHTLSLSGIYQGLFFHFEQSNVIPNEVRLKVEQRLVARSGHFPSFPR